MILIAKKYNRIVTGALLFACLLSFSSCAGRHTVKNHQPDDCANLRRSVDSITRRYNATIGVAMMMLEDRDTLTINNAHSYPMMSVVKFPLALAVLHRVDEGILALSQNIHISKDDLHADTWSPLREKYPDGNIDIPLRELLEYTVSKSDNNGCDKLFGLVGGTKLVNDYIHSLGYKEIAIAATEQQMGSAWEVQFTNWAQPYTLVQLLDGLYHKKILSPTNTERLLKIMEETETGPKRLKGLLPPGTIVAHKTGTSGTSDKGMMAAINDVGIITLPNGKHLAIAVLVSDTMESPDTNEKIIAEVAKAAYDYFSNNTD